MSSFGDNTLDGLTPEDILNQLPGSIYWKNKEGMLCGCNDVTARNLRLPNREAYQGQSDYDLFTKEQADVIANVDREVIRTKKVVITEDDYASLDGKEKIYLSHKAPLFNASGDVVGVSGISLDVTEDRHKQLNRLHLLENIVSMLPGHVYWKDLNGHYLGCNEAQAKTLGLKSAKDIVHVTPYESYSVDEGQRLMESDKAIMMGEKTVTLEEEGLREDGSRGIFLTKKTPIYDDQSIVIGLLGVSFDITDRKEQERELEEAKANAERANQLKTDFISNMEHDIRSPFCAITTFATALRDDEADPEKRESLDFIAESGETLLKLCNEMLEFSKLENGTVAQLDKKFRMQNLVERVERLESIVAADKGLKFVVNYDMTIPPVLIGDHFRIFRTLLNLLSNALKFTKDGSVTLTVQCLKKEKREALIRFVIEDTGIGMPEDKQQYIFERFSRLTRSNAGLYQGLGVGLPIVKKFMHALEGEIDLESIEGKGTTFVCTIPLVIPLTNDFVPSINP